MAGNIWVIVEQWRGQLSEITFELLALGRELADGMGTPLQAVLLGYEARALAEQLGAADEVLYVDHEALEDPSPEAYSQALALLVQEKQPASLLIPATNVAAEVLGSLPAQLGAPFANLCRDVRVVDGRLEAHCLVAGGKMEAAVVATAAPTILGIMPGVRRADDGRVEKTPSVEEVTPNLPETLRVRFKRYIEPEVGDVDVTQQSALVSVGRGIQMQDNVELAEALAAALGGAVCASRPVVDQGWLPLSRQVGKSGAIVKPRIYVAAGISGAPEHVEGMKDAELIVAINMDPQAPIFDVAHFGVVGDALDVLPALTEAVQARKG
ncbi:MAG: electron transfer flavoprotein subunit alpha/FixB family protein [Planctomycetota bacterium]|jgi:electron transfer flavoprotein alpha subunit